jgi:hypothetical protein
MAKQPGFAICHLRFAIQDAFFSILLGPDRAAQMSRRKPSLRIDG